MRRHLGPISQVAHQAGGGEAVAVDEAVGEARGAGGGDEGAPIGHKPRHCRPAAVVQLEHFALVGGQVGGGALEGGQDGVGVGLKEGGRVIGGA